MNRRAQPATTVRSIKIANHLKVMTRDGRSQVKVIEDALDRVADDDAKRLASARAEIDAIVARIAASGHYIRSMAEFDADEYDERGNLR